MLDYSFLIHCQMITMNVVFDNKLEFVVNICRSYGTQLCDVSKSSKD